MNTSTILFLILVVAVVVVAAMLGRHRTATPFSGGDNDVPDEEARAYKRLRVELEREVLQLAQQGDPNLWVFLDRRRDGTERFPRRPYLGACLRSLRRHNVKDFRVLVVDDRAFQHLVPDWPFGDLTRMGETQRRMARTLGQLHLLFLHGGLVVPPAFWCRRSLRPMFDAALSGGSSPPFCVHLPGPSALRPILGPGTKGEGGEDAPVRPVPSAGSSGGGSLAPETRDEVAAALAFFGCRPRCEQVQRLIAQTRFQADAILESEELRFFRRRSSSMPQAEAMLSMRALCAGRNLSVPLAVHGGGDESTAPRFAPHPVATGVRRVGVNMQRTKGAWSELRGMPELVRARMRVLDPATVGRTDCRGDSVTLAQLLGATPVQFSEDAAGVWIPEEELLASRFFDWFPDLSTAAMRAKPTFVLAALLASEE
jgi:hypothetical protein